MAFHNEEGQAIWYQWAPRLLQPNLSSQGECIKTQIECLPRSLAAGFLFSCSPFSCSKVAFFLHWSCLYLCQKINTKYKIESIILTAQYVTHSNWKNKKHSVVQCIPTCDGIVNWRGCSIGVGEWASNSGFKFQMELNFFFSAMNRHSFV